jgi:hypothetical protein
MANGNSFGEEAEVTEYAEVCHTKVLRFQN